jgi:hypothetical protein
MAAILDVFPLRWQMRRAAAIDESRAKGSVGQQDFSQLGRRHLQRAKQAKTTTQYMPSSYLFRLLGI